MKKPAKRTKLAYPCRVCVQDCAMEEESIQCDGCQSWLHQKCLHMSQSQYLEYGDKTLNDSRGRKV